MIVVDEELQDPAIVRAIAQWYPGRVVSLPLLRPETVIKDEAVPSILRTLKRATFVTINVDDYWLKEPADSKYCIVCVGLPNNRVAQVSGWLRHLLSYAEFKTKAARMGVVALMRPTRTEFYRADRKIQTLLWQEKLSPK